jgi:hypothetical protein
MNKRKSKKINVKVHVFAEILLILQQEMMQDAHEPI